MIKFMVGTLLCLCTASLNFADVMYSYSGELTPGASNHSQIADTETWTATFLVDHIVPDSNPSSSVGNYLGAIRSGSISFSGGYTATVGTLGTAKVEVFDDALLGVAFADGISATVSEGSGFLKVQALTWTVATPNPLLSSDALPDAGFSFGPSGSPGFIPFYLLTFNDPDLVGESVQYELDPSNISFFASVPEPSTTFMVGLIAVGLLGRRKRKG